MSVYGCWMGAFVRDGVAVNAAHTCADMKPLRFWTLNWILMRIHCRLCGSVESAAYSIALQGRP